jgi:hypothetical protein
MYSATDAVIDGVPVQFHTRFVYTRDEESDEVRTYKHLQFKSFGYWGYYKTLVMNSAGAVLYMYRGTNTQEEFMATFKKLGYFRCAAIREQIAHAERRYNSDVDWLRSIPCCNCYYDGEDDGGCDCDDVYRDAGEQVVAVRQELARLHAELAAARKERAALKKAKKGT